MWRGPLIGSSVARMRRFLLVAAIVGTALATAAPASAITFGQLDGNRHPNVGALFADWDPDSPGQDLLCSGTLISREDFLTASHCTEFLPAIGVDPDEVFVSFDPDPLNPDGTVKSTTTMLPRPTTRTPSTAPRAVTCTTSPSWSWTPRIPLRSRRGFPR
jgi:hypothetical protein